MPETTLIPEGYHALSLEDMRKQVRAIIRREDWRVIHDLVPRYYGPLGVLVDIDTDSEYNDEGGYNDRFSGFSVTTADEQMCEVDLTLPWLEEEIQKDPKDWEWDWEALRTRILACREKNEPLDEYLVGDIRKWVEDLIDEHLRDCLSPVSRIYDLRQEPVLPYAIVLAPIHPTKETTHA